MPRGGHRTINPADYIGKKYNRLTIIDVYLRPISSGVNKSYADCLCDCKTPVTALLYDIRRGHTVSCGCYNLENTIKKGKNNKTHGQSRGTSRTRLYGIWQGMKQRCYNPNALHYEYWGGRGIKICDEWLNDYEAFRDWALANGHRNDLSIDRIDNDKGYSPDNCRWATDETQARNQRINNKNKSGAKGIHYNKRAQSWKVSLGKIHIGYFKELGEAVSARNQAEKEYWKEDV